MNRRLGISIWGVLSLTVGVLIAEYAFAPLRDPYPAADTALPASDAEPTARPKETETPARPAPRKLPPLRLERQDAAGEAQGDPMYAAVPRPLFDSVWQDGDVSSSAGEPIRVSLASPVALAGEPATGARSTAGAGLTGLGGTFLGTQRRQRAAALQSGSSSSEATVQDTDEATASDSEAAPETTSSRPEPSVPGAADGSPPSGMPPSTEPVTGGDASPATSLPLAPRDELADTPQEAAAPAELPTGIDEGPPPPLPQVTVPEPLPGSLLFVGMLLGVLSRRRRRASLH